MANSYINYYRWIYRQNGFVCQSISKSVGKSDTSLYGFSCLNPTVIPSVKASTKKYTSSYFLVF
jgi:hypothetical protein